MRNEKIENAINGRLVKMLRQTTQMKSSRRFHIAGAGVVVLLVMMAMPTRVFAQGTTIVDTPYAETVENPCVAGEFVALTGRMVVAMYVRPDGAGGNHFTFRTITKAQGTTTNPLNPKKYVLNDENVSELNQPSSTAVEATQVINHGLIRQGELTSGDISLGGADDFMLKSTFHFTVNSSGVPTALVDKGRSSCM